MKTWFGLVLGLGVALGSCSDDSGYYFAPVDGGGTGADSGLDAGGDSGSEDVVQVDLGFDTAGDDVPADVGSDVGDGLGGGVVVYEVRAPDISQLEAGGVGAGFREPAAEAVPVAVVGACSIYAAGSAGALFEPGASVDAGEVTVQIAGETHVLEYAEGAEGGSYSLRDAEEGRIEYFDDGDAISVEVAGGPGLGAFTATLSAPDAPTIVAPTWGFGDSHDRSEPLAVSWAGGAASSVVINILPVTVFPSPGIAEGNSVTCVVGDTGSYSVPAEALSYLPEGSGLGGGTVALTVVRSALTHPAMAGEGVTVSAVASQTIVGAVP
ncbi:MAG: hypothetical protein H6698_08275 [Myxococcales bacterium]|nr:hypothetical protein [Myxococcales bacterium]MCB9534285.1 hypothetical protein [Myxococcales bacterium]